MAYIKEDNMLQDLKGLVSIESVSGQPEGELPFGKGPHLALEYCLDLCSKLGFRTGRCENYMGYAEIGEGDKLMGDFSPPGRGSRRSRLDGGTFLMPRSKEIVSTDAV